MAPPIYAKRMWRKQAALLKRETTYGIDAAPTGAANAMLITDATITAIEGEEIERDYYLPYLGHQGVVPVGLYGRIEFGLDVAGAGAAGTAPAYGPALRACAMSEVISAGVSVTYSPVSGAFDAATIYFNLDGVQHILLGARGTVTVDPAPSKLPRFKFTFTGLLGQIADAALPSLTLTAWRKAKPGSKAATTLTLHGMEQVCETSSIDLGNQVEPRMLIGEESIQITDRKARGSVVVEAPPLATKNWFSAYTGETLGAMSLVHGTVAGDIVEFSAPSVQIGKPVYGQTQGVANVTLPLIFRPVAGNDELSIIVR